MAAQDLENQKSSLELDSNVEPSDTELQPAPDSENATLIAKQSASLSESSGYESDSSESSASELDPLDQESDQDDQDPRTKVLTVLELEDLFTTAAPDLSGMSLSYLRCYRS